MLQRRKTKLIRAARAARAARKVLPSSLRRKRLLANKLKPGIKRSVSTLSKTPATSSGNMNTYQAIMFIEALKEVGITPKNVVIDHKSAYNFNMGKRYEIIFPRKLVNACKNRWKGSKIYDYSFMGMHTAKRNWVKNYTEKGKIVFTNNRGNLKKTKNQYDMDYYDLMTKSKFVLCPAGDFLWTYRFAEAIMCGSIPVIKKGTGARNMEGFKFYYTDELHNYDLAVAHSNYQLFLQKHTINE